MAALFGTAIGSGEAEARRGKGRRAAVVRSVYAPPFAAMVVDANTGRAMHAVNEDELRHPASVTKVMTLYLLFEQIERGNLQLDSELKVSRHAASQAPSKLGIAPGQTIEVEDAIKALVTKSANDVAAAIAENIAGSEEAFAARMTRKAHQLGMKRTVFRNASGLPDREQVTTARDLTVLARAVQEKFPRLYKYFQTRSFTYAGQTIGNHNRLIGRIEGVDGIKTGFTNASGFNLMTSARLDGRHVVGVVLGGRSGASRDNIMAALIRTNLARASIGGRASVFANLTESDDGDEAVPARSRLAAATLDVETTASTGARRPLDLRETRPDTAVQPTSSVRIGAPAAAALPAAEPARAAPPITRAATGKIEGRLPALPAVPQSHPEPAARPELARPEIAAAKPAPARVAAAAEQEAAAPRARAVSVSPWVIQLAAEDNEDKALSLLDQAKSSSGRTLASAAPFTEKVLRGGATLYRARFSGFAEADTAQEACKTLKSRGFACFATRS